MYAAPPPSPATSVSEIGPASCPSSQRSARCASLSPIEVVRLRLKMPSSGSVSISPIKEKTQRSGPPHSTSLQLHLNPQGRPKLNLWCVGMVSTI
ncbi:unnamed protein product [Cuscuta campestris]|uniref:Uncharacterized protein n=1 Tax=Cuscuta campestris TaxID=132261 RepID=A0A484M6T9_9ASTE|nr:unnamed protein product [Cuscuta campestris]